MQLGLQSMFYRYEWGFNIWDQYNLATTIQHLDIVCCRRDSAALQAVISSDLPFLLTTSSDPWFWKGGQLPIVRLELEMDPMLGTELNIIGLMEDDDRCLRSDVLLDQNHIYVEPRQIQQVWVECHASAQTPAGSYHGTIRMYVHELFEDERLAGECTFTVTVKDMELPEPKDYSFYLDLWQHNSNIARKYEVSLWSDEHFAVIDAYLQSMGELGQKAVSLVVSEIPWSGQNSFKDREPSDLFEYSIVRVRKSTDGQFHYDFGALDRYVRLGERHGIRGEIEIFGLLNIWQTPEAGYGAIVEGHPDGIRVRYYDEGSGIYRFIRDCGELSDYIQALEAHLTAMGWMERVRVLADEPKDVEQFLHRLEWLRGIVPSFQYKVAINHAEFIKRNLEGVHDYVPKLDCVSSEYDRLLELKPQIPGKLLFYVCCNPKRPNMFIGSPPLECRILPWLVERLGLDGFLRWNYTVWPDHPREQVTYRTVRWPAGDMNLVYPGRMGKPMLSLRYKWLQRGIRDYEIMQLLKGRGEEDKVAALLDSVFTYEHPSELVPGYPINNDRPYNMDPSAYDRLTAEL
jgi:hypothetical protein